MSNRSPCRILSFDGGGIRGLLSLVVLERLDAEVPGWLDSVDLLAGTSTGGTIALGLAHGVPVPTLRALYEDKGPKIFDDSWLDDHHGPDAAGSPRTRQGGRDHSPITMHRRPDYGAAPELLMSVPAERPRADVRSPPLRSPSFLCSEEGCVWGPGENVVLTPTPVRTESPRVLAILGPRGARRINRADSLVRGASRAATA